MQMLLEMEIEDIEFLLNANTLLLQTVMHITKTITTLKPNLITIKISVTVITVYLGLKQHIRVGSEKIQDLNYYQIENLTWRGKLASSSDQI